MNSRAFLTKVILKSLFIFIALNLVFALIPNGIGQVSLYNHFFPGRTRLPYGENPGESYNLSLNDLDAMFASHDISRKKPDDEYRVIMLGDSALWGWMLRPQQTLAGQLSAREITSCDGRRVQVYNLGYPTMSLTKDLLILDKAISHHPDLVIWLVTLEALSSDKQLAVPLVFNNVDRMRELIKKYSLPFDPEDPAFDHNVFFERTLIGQRRPLADLVRLQFFGVLWAGTGIDQAYPQDFERTQVDFEIDERFHQLRPPDLDGADLAFQVLDAGMNATGEIPILLVNQPIFISNGMNSNLRYNSFYPRWAYDQYRETLAGHAAGMGWAYFDLWDLVPAEEFTNTPFHMTAQGESIFADEIQSVIMQKGCR